MRPRWARRCSRSLHPETVDAVIDNGLDQYTPFTIVSAPALRRALAIARMTRVATTRQELRLHTAAVAVPVVAGGGAVVAALELTISGAGYQLNVIQSAVVVAAHALSRELTAGQRRSRPDRLAVLQRPMVIPMRTGAVPVPSTAGSPVPITAVRAERPSAVVPPPAEPPLQRRHCDRTRRHRPRDGPSVPDHGTARG